MSVEAIERDEGRGERDEGSASEQELGVCFREGIQEVTIGPVRAQLEHRNGAFYVHNVEGADEGAAMAGFLRFVVRLTRLGDVYFPLRDDPEYDALRGLGIRLGAWKEFEIWKLGRNAELG